MDPSKPVKALKDARETVAEKAGTEVFPCARSRDERTRCLLVSNGSASPRSQEDLALHPALVEGSQRFRGVSKVRDRVDHWSELVE